jgi:NADH-quinone oxidoreductase subunit M
MYNHILSIVLFTPLIGALLLLFVPKQNKNAIRWLANIFAMLGFAVSLPLIPWFWALKDRAGFQFVEGRPNNWIPTIGAGYVIGIDGISFLLIMLTTLLGAISILSSWEAIQDRVKEYYVWFLVLQTGMLGVFMANDMFLFFVFWEAMLVPMYLLIGIWGGPRKLYAAIKFFLYTLFGSVLMLLGILFLYFHHHTLTGVYTFYLPDLYATAPKIGGHAAIWLFFAFFLGFAIKVPMFPFHTWLPDAHVEAPTAGSVILAGVMLKMGTYGLVRFAFPLFPEAAAYFAPALALLAVIGIIYGALVAMVQPDMKKLVAYSSVSHLGFVVLGIAAMNTQGVSGAVYQMLSHGISTGGLFLIVGMLSDRRHTRLIAEYGGLKKIAPHLVAAFLLVTLASIGLPGLNGFVGEFLILLGAFRWEPRLAAFAATGMILSATYMLWMFQRVNYGPVTNDKNTTLADLQPREWAVIVPIIAVAILMGVVPNLFLRPIEPAVDRMLNHFHQGASTRVQLEPPAAASRITIAPTTGLEPPAPATWFASEVRR